MLRSNRAWQRLWLSETIGSFGGALATFALPVTLVLVGASTLAVSVIMSAQGLVTIVSSQLAGAIADTLDHRRTLLTATGVRAIACGTAWATLAFWPDALLLVGVSICVASGAGSICSTVTSVAVSTIVRREDISTAQSLNEARSSGAALAGGPVGGVLVGIRPHLPFLADTIGYLIAFVLLLPVKLSTKPIRQGGSITGRMGEILATAASGVRIAFSDPVQRSIGLFALLLNAGSSVFFFVFLVGRSQDGAPAAQTGLLMGAYAAAALLGSFAGIAVIRNVRPLFTFAASAILVCGGAWVAVSSASLIAQVLGMAAIGIMVPILSATLVSYQLVSLPEETRGRVLSGTTLLASAANPLMPITAGALLSLTSAGVAFTVSIFVMGSAVLVVIASPQLRRLLPSREW